MMADLIRRRIDTFWGYGSLDALVWFVGMEERFDLAAGEEKLWKQFEYADSNMQKGMLDVDRSRISDWGYFPNMSPFLPDAGLQRTWRMPIALFLYLRDAVRPTESKVLEFQRNILADGKLKEASTLELSSLPAPSTNDWSLYERHHIPGLESRAKYCRTFLLKRANQLRELVQKHAPRLVIMYGTSYLRLWDTVTGGSFQDPVTMPNKIAKTYFSHNSTTSFCLIPQRYFARDSMYKYADFIRERI